VFSIRLDQNLHQGEIDDKKHTNTGESYRVVEAQSVKKTEEKRLDKDLLTEFVQGASKSGNVEDFVCYYSSNFWSVINIYRSTWWLSNKSIHQSREPFNYLSRYQDITILYNVSIQINNIILGFNQNKIWIKYKMLYIQD
jgi:hypothetical protein